MVGREILIKGGPTDGEERTETNDLGGCILYLTPGKVFQSRIVAGDCLIDLRRVDGNEEADVRDGFADEVETAVIVTKQFHIGKDENNHNVSNQTKRKIEGASAKVIDVRDEIERVDGGFT